MSHRPFTRFAALASLAFLAGCGDSPGGPSSSLSDQELVALMMGISASGISASGSNASGSDAVGNNNAFIHAPGTPGSFLFWPNDGF